MYIHPTAVIDDGAKIGTGTKVWHFTHVMAEADIGKNCVLGQNVFVGAGVRIGHRSKIQNNVSVYAGVVLEEAVFIGPSVVFTNVINPRSDVDRKSEFQPTLVSEGATIGANATILCGIKIGKHAFIGAGAVVTRSVAPFALVLGNPARPAGWVSRMGYKLDFDQSGVAVCPGDQSRYQLSDELVMPIP